ARRDLGEVAALGAERLRKRAARLDRRADADERAPEPRLGALELRHVERLEEREPGAEHERHLPEHDDHVAAPREAERRPARRREARRARRAERDARREEPPLAEERRRGARVGRLEASLHLSARRGVERRVLEDRHDQPSTVAARTSSRLVEPSRTRPRPSWRSVVSPRRSASAASSASSMPRAMRAPRSRSIARSSKIARRPL